MTSARWLPVDTVLGDEVAKATDAALTPLAAQARHIRRTATLATVLLLGSAVALVIVAAGPSGWFWAFAAVASAAFGFLLAYRTNRIWAGDQRWMGQHNRLLAVPELPQLAALLLTELRSGARRARYRRAQSGGDKELRPQLLRGPFGSLLLSSDPEVQSLALLDWLGGDQLFIEIDQVERWPVAADRLAELNNPSSGDSAVPNPLGLDHRLLMAPEALSRLLARAYAPQTRGTRNSLIVDAIMLGNELVMSGLVPKLTKTFVDMIVIGLKSPNEIPVYLRADDGSKSSSTYVFCHQKARDAGHQKVGLKVGSDSTSWVEQVVTGRYKDVKRSLDVAEDQLRA